MRRRPIIFAILLLLAPGAVLSAAGIKEAEAELLAIKSRLPFISLDEFLYHREPRDHSGDGKVTSAWKTLMRLDSPSLAIVDLQTLTSHKDADIRALALLALVAKETPEVVPVCIRLLYDKATTIPAQFEPGGRIPGERQIYTAPQTVGEIAGKVLKFVDCPLRWNNDGGVRIEPSATAWWAVRKGNPDWLAWYDFLYQRASQGTSSPSANAKADMQRFRKQLDALPPVTRGWAFLYLAELPPGPDSQFATDQEIIDAVRALGADALIEFLHTGKRLRLREPSLDDGRKGRGFLSTHASRIFTEEQAETLLQLQLFVAAADANPKIVRRAVEAALRHHAREFEMYERAKAMAALASLGDESDRDSAVKWFFDEPNKEGGSTAQDLFIQELQRRRPSEWRDIVRRIVSHPDFERLRPLDVVYLALMVDKLGGERLIGVGSRFREDAENTRRRLRDHFGIENPADTVFKAPDSFLTGPAWKVELVELGNSLGVSDDGKRIAIGMATKGQGVRILDATNGKEVRRLPWDGESLDVVFSKSRHALLSASGFDGKSEFVWRGQGESETNVLSRRARLVVAPSGMHVAAINTDLLAWLTLPGGENVWQYAYRNRFPHNLAISPDSSRIAISDGWSKEITLIDTADGTRRHTLVGHASTPSKFRFSADSRWLASVGEDDRVFLWNVADGQPIARFRGTNIHFGPIAFASDAQSFFAVGGHGVLAAYAVADGRTRYGIKYKGNWIQSAVPSADGKHLYLMIQADNPNLRLTGKTSRVECWELP